MAIINKIPDYYLIGQVNNTNQPYAINTEQQLGGYSNRSHTCNEAVFKLDISTIPAGSEITAVSFTVNITSNNDGSSTPNDICVREQDKGTWNDDGSTEPARNNPAFFNTTAGAGEVVYQNILTQYTLPIGGDGTITIPSSAAMVGLVTDYMNGVKDINNGLILTYYPEYYSYYLNVDSIQYTIEYKASAPSLRRRLIITQGF